jgi:hypothetical protein
MLAGEGPFDAPTAQGRIARSLTETPRPIHTLRPAVNEALDAALATALAKVPADRFATAEAFGDALAGVASPTASTGAIGTVSQRAALRPWMGIAVATVLLLAAIGGALDLTSFVREEGKIPSGRCQKRRANRRCRSRRGRTRRCAASSPVPGTRPRARFQRYRDSRQTPREIG